MIILISHDNNNSLLNKRVIKEPRIKLYLYAILPMLFWGLSYVWVKIVFKYYGPITTTFIRLFISSIFLLIIYLLIKKKETVRKEDIKYFLFLAFVDPFGYFLCESYGLKLVTAVIGSVIISTIPIFSSLLGVYFYKEKFTVINFLGGLVSFIGIAIIVLKKDFTFIASPIGIMLIFSAVLCSLIYVMFIKNLTQRYSPITILLTQNIIGTIYLLPLLCIFEFNNSIRITPNFELISTLILLSILGSTLSFLMYMTVIKKIGISKANMFTNLISVFTLAASYFLLNEIISLKMVTGISVIIIGLYISQIKYEFNLRNS